jgi:DNA-binding transcriptional LysR family regulator
VRLTALIRRESARAVELLQVAGRVGAGESAKRAFEAELAAADAHFSLLERIRAEAADADLRQLQDGSVGRLRLGVFPSVGARVVPPPLKRLSENWAQVDLLLVEDASDRLLREQVEAAELDLSFAMMPLGDGPVAAVEVLRDPYVVLPGADPPIAEGRRAVGPRELGELPLISFRHSQAYPEAFLTAHGITAGSAFESTTTRRWSDSSPPGRPGARASGDGSCRGRPRCSPTLEPTRPAAH